MESTKSVNSGVPVGPPVYRGAPLAKETVKPPVVRQSVKEEKRRTADEWGDTLCVCLYCGIVFVAEFIAEKSVKVHLLKARDIFRGVKCPYCFLERKVERSEYRLLIGPIRAPRIER